MSGLIKGVGHAIKSVVKGVTHFVKKYWVAIAIAAAIVFTAGIASVGVGAWTSAMSAGASSGFGGFMGAVGSTFSAGAATLTGGMIGSTAGLSSLAAGGSAAAGAAGATAGVAGTAGTAGFATPLGVGGEAYTGVGAVGAAAPGLTAPYAAVTGAAGAGTGAATVANALPATQSASVVGGSSGIGSGTLAPVADVSTAGATTPIAGVSAAQTSGSGLLGTVLNSKAAGPLLYGGMQALQGAAQGQMMQQEMDATKPLGFFGVGVRGNAPNANISSVFGTNESLTGGSTSGSPFAPVNPQLQAINLQGQSAQPMQQISPYVADARANLPNGVQWMPNLPNANQGLMTMGWNVKTGQPIYAPVPNQPYPGA